MNTSSVHFNVCSHIGKFDSQLVIDVPDDSSPDVSDSDVSDGSDSETRKRNAIFDLVSAESCWKYQAAQDLLAFSELCWKCQETHELLPPLKRPRWKAGALSPV